MYLKNSTMEKDELDNENNQFSGILIETELLSNHTNNINFIEFSNSKKYIAYVCKNSFQLLNRDEGTWSKILEINEITSLIFSSDENYLILSAYSKIYIIEISTLNIINEITFRYDDFKILLFSKKYDFILIEINYISNYYDPPNHGNEIIIYYIDSNEKITIKELYKGFFDLTSIKTGPNCYEELLPRNDKSEAFLSENEKIILLKNEYDIVILNSNLNIIFSKEFNQKVEKAFFINETEVCILLNYHPNNYYKYNKGNEFSILKFNYLTNKLLFEKNISLENHNSHPHIFSNYLIFDNIKHSNIYDHKYDHYLRVYNYNTELIFNIPINEEYIKKFELFQVSSRLEICVQINDYIVVIDKKHEYYYIFNFWGAEDEIKNIYFYDEDFIIIVYNNCIEFYNFRFDYSFIKIFSTQENDFIIVSENKFFWIDNDKYINKYLKIIENDLIRELNSNDNKLLKKKDLIKNNLK